MATRIEVPVSLGIKEAIAQADELKKILNESVQPNTKGYQSILNLLNKIGTVATGLQGKLSTAFTTSKTSSSFLKDYEKLLEMLNTVKASFSGLGLSEIKLTVEDSNKVEEYTKKIKELQDQINAVSGGKIGGFFNLDEFKEAKNLLEQLKIDPSNFSFKGLSDELNEEIDKTKDSMAQMDQQFQNARNVVDNLGKGNLDNLNDSLLKAAENADGLIRKISDSETKIDINAKLKNAFEAMDGIDLKAKFITSDTNVEKFIQDETKRVIEAYDARIAELTAIKPKIDAAMNALKGQKTNADTLAIINSESVHNAFNLLGLEAEYQKFIGQVKEQGEAGAQAIAASMSKMLSGVTNIDELKGWRDAITTEIEDIFGNAGDIIVNKSSSFKKALQSIFSDADIDVKSIPQLNEIFDKIKDGDNAADVLHRIAEAFKEYATSASESNTDNVAKYNELTTKLQLLEKAVKGVNSAEESGKNSIEAKRQEISSLEDAIIQLIKKYQELTGKEIELHVNTNGINKGKSALENYINALTKLENKQKALSNIQMAINRWMGFYQVLNLTKRAINDMKTHIQELDAVMTKIAVVTKMSQNDLWNQIGTYSEIARQYGVAIKGVYEVSQIYYQQGLNKSDVMTLTTETLKMARIAGLDYATAADYMTTAIRGFKLEMTDAAHVTDVFSNLAAHTASSTEELAIAISKTAASAASVGASFEATSAMMATMIATTRESATNIGTALKSIISRYGELKENMTGTDAEGEEYSLNKVDKALQSVGITIHDAAGQFRDFDDVILELATAWDTIDTNTQRYIATVMAGNRQQSRFLALVSNVEEYKKALELANNADATGEIQTLKTLDSIDAKIERMKVTIQEFYTSSGIQDLYKNVLDTITNIISGANSLPKIFGKIPGLALTVGFQIINIIKNVAKLAIQTIATSIESLKGTSGSVLTGITSLFGRGGTEAGRSWRENADKEMSKVGQGVSVSAGKNLASIIGTRAGALISMAGSALSLQALSKYGASTDKNQDQAAAGSMFGAAALTGTGSALSGAITGFATGGPWGAVAGGVIGLASGLPSLISAINMNNVTKARELELSNKSLTETKQNATVAKGVSNELTNAYNKLETLYDTQFDSIESMQEYKDYMNELASAYPELVSQMETTGDKIITLTDLETSLAEARVNAAQATADAAYEELNNNQKKKDLYQEILDTNMFNPTIWSVAGTRDDMYINLANLVGASQGTYSSRTLWNILDKYESWRQQQENPNNYAEWDINKWGGSFLYGTAVDNWINDSTNKDDFTKFIMSQLRVATGSNYDIFQSSLSAQLINNLNAIKEKFTQGGLDFSLNELLGRQVESIDSIKTWSIDDILDASEKLHERLEKYINNSVTQIDTVSDYLNRVNIELGVQHNLESLEDPHTANELNEYASLMSFMLEGRYKNTEEPINWEEAGNQDIISSLREWVNKNREAAQELMNIDYSQYRSFDEIDFGTEVTEIEGWDEYLEKSFLPAFNQARTRVLKGFSEQLENVQLQDSIFSSLIDDSKENGELNTALVSSLRTGITQYRTLIDKELNQEATNLLTSLSYIYSIIGSYTSDKQALISSIITNIDWSNDASISSAADSLRNLGPEFEELAEELDLAALRFASSLTTRIMQLRDSAKDTAKNIEQVADQIGKGVKTSEALENVNTMLENYTGDDKDNLTFDQLYQWDDVLNGYTLTEKGISVWFNSINTQTTEDIDKAKQQLKEIQAIYGDQETQGIIFSAEKGISRKDISNALIELYRDNEGIVHATESQIEATTDAFMVDYERLQKEFSEQTDLTWAEFIQKKKDSLTLTNESEIATLEAMPAQILASKIAAVDYKSIAGGTHDKNARTNLEALLKSAGIDESELGEAFDNIWNRLLEGDYEAYNDLLKRYNVNFQVSSEAEIESARADFEQYQDAFNEIFTKPIESWSKATKELAGITADTDLSTIDIGAVADNFLESIQRLISIGVVSIEEYNSIISSRIKYNQEQAGVGKQKKLFNAMSNGFTIDELVSLGGMDENGNLKSELSGLIELDTVTGDYKIKAKATVTETIQALAKALNITLDTTSEAYKDAISSGVDEANSKAEKQNSDLQAKKVFESLRSATVGTNINASQSNLAQYILKKAGFNVDADGNVTIESEEDLKKIAELERVLREDVSEETKAANPEVVKYINEMVRTYKSDRNRYSALAGIISKTVNTDAAEKVQKAFGDTGTTDAFMESLGFYYENELGVYIAAADSIEKIQEKIDKLNTSIKNESDKDIQRQLQEQATALQSALNLLQAQFNDPNSAKRSALGNLLSNYTDISNEVYSEFMAQFGLKEENVAGVFTIKKGKREADLNKLKTIVSEDWAEYFQSYIDALADEYMSNAQKAGELVTQGTTSQTEITAFKEAYTKLMGTNIDFYYDSVLKAWTFDPVYLRGYIEKQADQLKLVGEERNKWIEDQINSLTVDNLNFSNYLSGTANEKDITTLKHDLVSYFETHTRNFSFLSAEELKKWAEGQVNSTLVILSKGGQEAINKLREIKGDAITQDEIEAAYKSQISLIQTAYDSIATLQKNSIVAENQIEILKAAGFTVDENGVIQSVGNLALAYKSLYQQMKNTNVATTAELNAVMGSYLDNRGTNQKEQIAIDAIGNAMGMTYTELSELYTRAGLNLTEKVVDLMESTGITENIGGNKFIIKDFAAFARTLGLSPNSEEYTSAFKTYNDSLIEYNKRVSSDIKQEFDNLLAAKPGDQINLTRMVSKYGADTINKSITNLGATLENGILSLTEEAQIPQLAKALGPYVVNAGGMLQTELEATLAQAMTQDNADFVNAYTDMIQNYNSISIDTIAKFAKGMGASYQAIVDTLGLKDIEGKGTYKMDLATVKALVDMGADAIGEETYNSLLEIIAGVQNNILSAISSAGGYVQNGTNSIADMQKFINELNTLTGSTLSIGDAFEYDTILNTFKLNANTLQTYVEAQKAELEKLGLSGKAIDEYINDQTITLLQQNINVEDFLNATGKTVKNEAATKLGQSIKDWYNATGTDITDAEIETILRTLDAGGEAAVAKLKEIKGINVSTDELEAVYNASSINRLRTAVTDLTKNVGDTVSGSVIAIMEAAEFDLAHLDDGTAVIKSVGSMVKAYSALYNAMSHNADATTADLNSLYAELLTSVDKENTDILDTLQNASGIAYSTFADLLTQYGIKFEDVMKKDINANGEAVDWGVEATGFGEIRIKDFEAFAKQMGWNIDSPEFKSAYSDYIDSMVELANTPMTMMQNAADELKNLTEAKVGQAINVTYLEALMKGSLADAVAGFGANLNNGILTLTDATDIPGLITSIANAAADAGAQIPEQLAELADAVADMLNKITSLLQGGISGSLSNVEAQQLQSWINSQKGFETYNIDFTQTKDGLQVSTKQAIELYNVLKSIDSIQASIVFEDLKKSLEESNENYKSASSMMRYMAELNDKIADVKTSKKRREQYKEELEIAKEIYAIRSTTEDDSFNFMSQDIPAGQNNPLNYWNNWVTAYDAIKESMFGGQGKTGYMEYNDFYNLVTEMGNLAEMTGQAIPLGERVLTNAEDAAKLITDAAGALKVTSDGSLKIDLSGIGVDFASSAESMSEGVDAGIHQLAQSQVDMLDGLIQLMDTIVAMEKLEDIDVDSNGIDLTDIFEIKYDETTGKESIIGFKEKYETWRKSIIDQITKGNENYNEDLAKAMSSIKINGTNLANMINWDVTDWQKAGTEVAQGYSDTLAALYKAALSNNYDLNNIAESVKQVLIESGVNNLTIDVGNTTLVLTTTGVTQIDWSKDSSKAVLESIKAQFGKDADTHAIASKAIADWQNGEKMKSFEVEWALQLDGRIRLEGDTKTVIWNGQEYGKGTAGYQAALAAWRLSDAGVEVTQEQVDQAAETGTAESVTIETTTSIGSKDNIHVKSTGAEITFSSDDFPGEYQSQEELLKNQYSWYQAQVKASTPDHQYHGPDYEEWLYQNYKIRVKANTMVTNEDGTALNLSQDATARQALKDYMNKDNLVALVQEGADGTGNYDVEIAPNIHLKLSGEEIDVEGQPGTIDSAKLTSALKSMLNIDESLVDTIKLGVTAAFTEMPDITLDANTDEALKKINELKEAAKEITSDLKVGQNEVEEKIKANVTTAASNNAQQNILVKNNNVWNAINNNVAHGANNPVYQTIILQGGEGSEATGTIGLAAGNAFAQGTLMGELGPELVVSNGHYFVVGQSGPEMVNLADDAIVFNHLQTKSLLEKGTSSGRGKAITNERNAVSFATGNINGGPAMASASAASATLKQLRAMWQSLLDVTTKDLAKKAGGGGGGGDKADAAFIKQLERWYDWLQEIAKLEKKINYEEAKRSKIASDFNKSGYEYVQSQKDSLKYLERQIAIEGDLVKEQEAFFKQEQNRLNTQSAFSDLYTFDDEGQIKYASGKFAELSEMFGSDSTTGKAFHSIDEQYDYLISQGYGYAMEYDSEGQAIDASDEEGKQKAIEAFWAKIEADQTGIQEIYDSIEEHKEAILEAQEAQNEILHEIEDNIITVENQVLNAVIDAAERQIKELEDQKDAIQEGNENLINGLTEQLNLEKQMYESQQDRDELERKRRKLSILQRSGGSASEIASLQKDIDNAARDEYFTKQQEQIDAIKLASDNELEKLQQQIDLMTETLNYQKEHGLLWNQVYEQLVKSPEEIATFIKENDSSYWGKSPTDLAQSMREDLFNAEKYKKFAEEGVAIESYLAKIAGVVAAERAAEEEEAEEKPITTEPTETPAPASEGGETASQAEAPVTCEWSEYKDDGIKGHHRVFHYSNGKVENGKTVPHVWPDGMAKIGDACKVCGWKFAGSTSEAKKTTTATTTTKSSGFETKSLKVGAGKVTKDIHSVTPLSADLNKKLQMIKYDSGGLVDEDSIALVHAKEGVLTPEQTSILRNDILGHGNDSLLSLLQDFRSAWQGIDSSEYSSIDKSSSVVIEHAEVNMKVEKLANSYDAAKAGDDVMREILNIASRSTASNRIQ